MSAKIAAKMVKALAAIDAVEKRGRNRAQGYDYVKTTDVANEVRKALHENGIAFSYRVLTERTWDLEREGKATMFFCSLHVEGTFTDSESGESLTSSAIGWGGDTQDKSAYKAMTGALKYLLRTTFLIPDELDPENEEKELAVKAEVARQKAKSSTLAEVRQDTAEIPPELDWAYQRSSGVLICRILDAKKGKKKEGGNEFVTLQINNTLDEQKGKKPLIYYWHNTHRDLLLGAKGKIVKIVVSDKKGFFDVQEVLEVDGVKIETPVSAGIKDIESPETQARLLASTLDMSEEDLEMVVNKLSKGDWSVALEGLRAEKQRRDTLPPA
jgi:sulfite reductase alpha subunit-like flavoprotein